jgi:flagellar biosynthesis/type III secretory pathway protein FliH
MVEMQDFVILTRAQVNELMREVKETADEAFLRGCMVGYGDKLEGIEEARREGYDAGNEAGYEVGYEHGYAQGEDDGFVDGVGDGYDDGFDDGYTEALADERAEAALPDDEWVEGWGRLS